MIPIEDARRLLLAHATRMPDEDVPLDRALGRCLAVPVAADRDFPPTDRSAMDGYAVRAADCGSGDAVLRVAGEVRAGQDPAGTAVAPGTAVRIMTGAIVPAGADAVVMVELTSAGPEPDTVRVGERVEAGQHVRRRGEDRVRGEAVLAPGRAIDAATIAALASVGVDPVRVVARPSVAVLSTGDEIVPPGSVPAPHQVRNSNAPALLAQLRTLGFPGEDLGIAGDDATALRDAIARGMERDLLLLTGGVSMGEYDLVGEVLDGLGADVLFHKVAMKPGKPILAARREGSVVLGLPGNPLSAFAGFVVFAAPFLGSRGGFDGATDRSVRARLAGPLRRRPGRTNLALARLTVDADGARVAPVPSTGSGDVLSLTRANAFAVAEPGRHLLPEGTEVDVLPWPGTAVERSESQA